MPRRLDWQFDVLEHITTHYAGKIAFVPDEEQNYSDRITGHVPGARAVIVPKAVGFDNANRFRRWVTLDPAHWAAMTNRPAGWRVFVLMVGLLPDGQPWWSALYDDQVLAQRRDYSEAMAGFYRFDPGLTEAALVADWDKDRPEGHRRDPLTVTTVYRCPTCGLLTDHEADDPTSSACPICGNEEPLFVYERTYPTIAGGEDPA